MPLDIPTAANPQAAGLVEQPANLQTTSEAEAWQALQQQLTDLPDQPRNIPPLERWHPAFCGDMDLLVKANGEWWHEGKKLTRQSMVSLFAKVLWAEVDADNQISYYLKTPVEKLRIRVEDAPLLITQVEQIEKQDNTYLQFASSQGDVVIADASHPIRLGLPFHTTQAGTTCAQSQAEQPYILVRQNGESVLYGLIHRNVFYHLLALGELCETEQGVTLRLTSGDAVFNLTMATEQS